MHCVFYPHGYCMTCIIVMRVRCSELARRTTTAMSNSSSSSYLSIVPTTGGAQTFNPRRDLVRPRGR